MPSSGAGLVVSVPINTYRLTPVINQNIILWKMPLRTKSSIFTYHVNHRDIWRGFCNRCDHYLGISEFM